jgi:transmembrane sensor
MPHDNQIREQALAWAVRTGDPEFADWEGFTCWLEENPAHAEVYDRVAVAAADAADDVASIPAGANDEEPAPARVSRRWFGGAIAASLAAVLAVGVWQASDERYSVETAPGEVRTVALADGGKIALAGGTRLLLEEDDSRFARLEQGQALFTIRHDESDPFRLEVGQDTLVDAGTVFDVRHTASAMTVAVAEGAVIFNPSRQNVRLEPGDILTSAAGSDEYTLGKAPLGQIGEWREGRVTFENASLAEIASELSRATGVAYRADRGAAGQSVSGSILVAPLREDPRALGPLLGVTVRPADDAWVIAAP